MANPQLNELVDYIKKASQAGQSEQQTRQILSKNGWSDAEVNEAFGVLVVNKTPQQPQAQTQPQPQPQVQPQMQQRPQPEIKVQPQQAQPQYQPMENKKFRRGGGHSVFKLFASLLIILIIISIVGTGIALATRFWDPPWSPFRPAPEKVILKAWDNLKQVKSENFSSKLLLSGKDIKSQNGGGTFDATVETSGGMDISDSQNKLALVQLSLGASGTDDSGYKYNISVSGELRLIGENLFVKLDNINLGEFESFLAMFNVDTAKLEGQWIKLDSKNVYNAYSDVPALEQTQEQKDAQESANKIVKILIDKKVYDIKQLPDNRGGEGKEYNYSISLNRAKFNDALPDIFNILNVSNPSGGYTLEAFKKDVNDTLDKIGDFSVNLFIGKNDGLFHKISFDKGIDINKFDNKSSGEIQISYKSEKSGINQPFQVSAPSDYKDFKDVFNEMAGPITKNRQVESDLSQVAEIAVSYFDSNKSFSSFCSKNGYLNGSLKTYGSELTRLSRDMVAQGTAWAKCFANAQSFCISVQLEDKSWLCVSKDSYFPGTTKCLSATTVCQ